MRYAVWLSHLNGFIIGVTSFIVLSTQDLSSKTTGWSLSIIAGGLLALHYIYSFASQEDIRKKAEDERTDKV